MNESRSATDNSEVQERADPPGAVSNQNGEEAEGAHGAGPGQPEPGTGESGGEDAHGGSASEPGAAGEGSQATGQRENAG